MGLVQIPKPIKDDPRGPMYSFGDVYCIIRHKGSISADHTHMEAEKLFLASGEIELTVEKTKEKISAPAFIEIESNVYHKVVALTDIILLEQRIASKPTL